MEGRTLGTCRGRAAEQLDRALGRPDGGSRQAELDLLGAPRARDPFLLALEMPPYRRLQRVLVRARLPAELAAGLRRAVGPPLPGRAHLERGKRPAPAARREHTRRR